MGSDLELLPDSTGREPGAEGGDALVVELEAMAAIGRALDAIDDPVIKQRVLRWAYHRWADRTAPVEPHAASMSLSNDPTLAVDADVIANAQDPALVIDSIDDLFTEARPNVQRAARESEVATKTPVESILRSLAADFQRLTDEWNGAQ